ncbi:N-acetylmuramoyl-L-alanine amidase [Enterococcus sp. LJL98]
MFNQKNKIYQMLTTVFIISILVSNSLIVYATDISETSTTVDSTELSISELMNGEGGIDPYFPLDPNEDDLIGDQINPGEVEAPVDTSNARSRSSKMNQEIINNVNNGTFKKAKIKEDWREYSMFPYQSLNGGTQNKPHGIVIHETANPKSTIEGEISYMDRNWRNAFVHAFVDQSQIIEIHDPSYGAWGAGREANKYFLHIELVEHPDNRTAFMKSVLNDAYYAASKLAQFDLEPSRPKKKKGDISGTIWSHHEVSTYLGGTNHSDPTGYFSKFGYSMEQFYELVQYEYENLSVILPDGKEVKKTGWHKLETGKWSFVEKKKLAKDWLEVGGKYYYFDSKGIMQQGWIKKGNDWYYLLSDGAMAKGWILAGGKWYYFNQSGVMQQGWIKEGNDWYYLLSDGVMAKDWISAGGKWYYFNQSGVMQQGWIKEGNDWYYLLPDGAMAKDWISIGDKWYYFNSSGIMVRN